MESQAQNMRNEFAGAEHNITHKHYGPYLDIREHQSAVTNPALKHTKNEII